MGKLPTESKENQNSNLAFRQAVSTLYDALDQKKFSVALKNFFVARFIDLKNFTYHLGKQRIESSSLTTKKIS